MTHPSTAAHICPRTFPSISHPSCNRMHSLPHISVNYPPFLQLCTSPPTHISVNYPPSLLLNTFSSHFPVNYLPILHTFCANRTEVERVLSTCVAMVSHADICAQPAQLTGSLKVLPEKAVVCIDTVSCQQSSSGV